MKKRLTYNLNLLPVSQNTNYPAISVIIPMYNAEKYIGECLDSILMQTFQDFEVIVVDDCSTDKSVAIVESYIPKFEGRLQLEKTKKNSGGGGYVPRNMGILLSRGEYICFVDADDFILLTALETLYEAAKEYDADVVYVSARYFLTEPNEVHTQIADKNKNSKSTLTVNDPNKNLQLFFLEGCHHTPYQKFCRRDFLIKNQIFFPEILLQGDAIWTIHVFCCSKRFLRLPVPLYFYRQNSSSITLHKNLSSEEQIIKHVRASLLAINTILNLSRKVNIQETNLMYLFLFMKNVLKSYLRRTLEARSEFSSDKVFESLYKEFVKEDAAFSWLIPLFFSTINEQQKSLNEPIAGLKSSKESFKSTSSPTARIDAKLMTAGDLQVFSISDNNAKVEKPDWYQKNGSGYVINSHDNKISFVAKASVDGQIRFGLRGIDIRDPKDKSKRVPYWIDYTKLIINGKTIFDTLTPTWHDKPYWYKIDAKADEEIKVEVEWIPHKSETQEQKSEPPKQEIITANKVEPQVPPKLINFPTARIDTKLMTAGNLQIISTSDDKATIDKPRWLQKNGMGYVVQSFVGTLNFVAKSNVDGQVQISLKGLRIINPEDKSKRPKNIPYWVDYTKLVINGKTIFDTLTPTWHDKPYDYIIDAKADEEIKIEVEWLPHRSEI